MRNLTVCGIFLILIAGSSLSQAAVLAPDWALASPEGEVTRLSAEVRQQPVVMFFWATWCPYCKALMPHLQSIRLEYGDKVKILAINFIEKRDPVKFIRDRAYDFTVLPKGEEVASMYGIYGTPGVILVDQGQQIRFDLRELPPLMPSGGKMPGSNKKKAAFLAPYWAAELRKSIDAVIEKSTE